MAATYSLGVFNDNFFKQAASLMAVYAGRQTFQSAIGVAFTLPFLLLAAPAGWLADRFPKRTIVIASKAMELAAMACGAVGIATESWPLVLVMMFLMGAQSTLFSPALNGSIPELYPAEHVLAANSTLKMVTTAAMLAGIILAGVALAYKIPLWGGVPAGRMLVAAGVVAVALAGVLLSLGVPRRPAARPDAKFPWSGPVDTLRTLWNLRTDRLLTVVLLADAFVWAVAVLQVLLVNQLGKEFCLTERGTSYLVVAELGGVAVGGLLARRLASGERWFRALPGAMFVLAGAMLLQGAAPQLPAPLRLLAVWTLLGIAGVAGGLLLVPLEAFFQVRPDPGQKGRIIAAANFAAFLAMMLAAAVSAPMLAHLPPAMGLAVLGAVTLPAALGLLWALNGRELR